MSRLKLQLLKKLPEFQRQAKYLRSQEARRRWNFLRYIAKSRESVRASCMKLGVSEEWFRKWCHRLLKAGHVRVLGGQSKAPKRSPNRIKGVWERRILMIRDAKPFEGCERIAHAIQDVYKKKYSASGINKVLNRNRRISKKRQKSLTKQHLKRYRRPLPGYLQMDFKYVPYRISGRQYYQLSCVDHHSSWRMIRIYPNKDLIAVESFLRELEVECPFAITQIQTDNDLAFTLKFWRLRMGFDPSFPHPMAEWCQENEVEHKLIPVGEKELNGKVENTHKQDDREFYSHINPQNLDHLQALSLVYEARWNERRKTKALGWRTPLESLWLAHVRALAWFIQLSLPLPTTVLRIPRRKETKMIRLESNKSNKKQRKDWLDRYVTWVKEDAKKYGTNE